MRRALSVAVSVSVGHCTAAYPFDVCVTDGAGLECQMGRSLAALPTRVVVPTSTMPVFSARASTTLSAVSAASHSPPPPPPTTATATATATTTTTTTTTAAAAAAAATTPALNPC